jgi:heptosyltransferase-2
MAGNSLDRVLIIQTAFLGDVVLATGLIEKVKQHFPDSEIDFLVRKGYESLFDHHPKINQLVVFDKSRQKILNLINVIRKVRSRRYDMIVNVQRFFSTGLITVLSRAIITIGFDKNPLSFFFSQKIRHERNGDHEIDRNHQLVAWFTDDQPAKPKLYPGGKNFKNVSVYQKNPYICIAPASIWFTKQFPVRKWIEIIEQLPTSVTIYLIGSRNDFVVGEKIRKEAGTGNILNLCGKLDLLDTAAIMSGSKINFVNDSAPMHIASAMNSPVCAVFCSTLPSFGYGPLSDDSHVLEIRGDLYCRPCGIHGRDKCPEGHFRCALEIETGQVSEMVQRILRK